MNPNITPVEPRQDAAAEVERLRELVRRAVPLIAVSTARIDHCRLWLKDAADTIGGEA
jgi:hypothetical protein